MSTTETSDFIHPSAVMTQSGVADEPGSIVLQARVSEQRSSRKRKHSDLVVGDQDAQELTPTPSTAAGEKAAQAEETTPEVIARKHYCTVCKEILPVSAFYPSYMQRHLACCKGCARAKQIEHKRKQSEAAQIRPARSDHTRSMLEQLRRRCSQSSHLEGCHKPLLVGFDVKVARPLLAFWKWQSALHTETFDSSGDVAAHASMASVGALATHPPSCTETLEPGSCNRTDSSQCTSVKQSSISCYEPLRWIVWAKSDLSPIEPWEIIPVTHKEALQFRNVPVAMRCKLVSDDVVQQIGHHLQRLRAICSSEPGLPVCNLLERHHQFLAANPCRRIDDATMR
jgi:hypothetical protein